MKTKRKVLSILVCLSLLVSLLVPLTAVQASTLNRVQSVPTLADDNSDLVQNLGALTLKEDSDYPDELAADTSFTVTFPSGVKLQSSTVIERVYTDAQGDLAYETLTQGTDYTISGDYTIDITIPSPTDPSTVDGIKISPKVKIDGFDGGDIEVTVDGFDSGITSGTYVLGRVGEGDTSAAMISTPTVGDGNAKGGIIRVTENSINAIGEDTQDITVKLPANFEWVVGSVDVDFLGGLSGSKLNSVTAEGRTLTINFDPAANRTQRGIIQITPWFTAQSDADYGEVEATIDGDNITAADLVIAKYADYGVAVASSGDNEQVVAGQIDAELTKLYIKENVAGSLLSGRKTRIEFPEGIKIVDFELSGVKNVDTNALSDALKADIDGDQNYVEFVVPDATSASSKIEFKILFTVSIQADFTGDVVATVSGRSGAEGEATVGTAVAPVTVTSSQSKELKIGLKDQPIGDIVITEGVDGAIMADNDYVGKGELEVVLPDGILWSDTPDVEVTEGNLEIDEDNIDTDHEILYIPIKSDSSKPSKITISNAKVDLDRTIAEGDVVADVQGSALVENFQDTSDGYDINGDSKGEDAGLFDEATAASAEVARVATPAPTTVKNNAVFTIGQSSYTLNGATVTMDVAPYLKNDRTYLPVRYIANAAGVTDDNIMWNDADQSVVLIKGDRVIKLTIGSNTMMINGVPFTMDVAPEIVDPGRTMLPLRWVAQALGCTVNWDEATQTVTVQ